LSRQQASFRPDRQPGTNNSTDPLDPIVKFEITSAVSGQVLGSFTTATITRHTVEPGTIWFQFHAALRRNFGHTHHVHNQIGGLGNDLTLDDIEFNLCGPEFREHPGRIQMVTRPASNLPSL
jgi:hypothetical protein